MFDFKRIAAYILLVLLLYAIYSWTANAAQKGYGYSGYRGFAHPHSFWYARNYEERMNFSNREDSVNGIGFSKKGLNGGK